MKKANYNLRLGMTLLLQSDLFTVGKPQIFFRRGSYSVVPASNINIYYAISFIYLGHICFPVHCLSLGTEKTITRPPDFYFETVKVISCSELEKLK